MTSPDPQRVEAHLDDVAVDAFVGLMAIAMKAKLARKRKDGRGGWQTCSPERLSIMLREHVEKGDPIDVANFCMMLHSVGGRIAAADTVQPTGRDEVRKLRGLLAQTAGAAEEAAGTPANRRIALEVIGRAARAALATITDAAGRGA